MQKNILVTIFMMTILFGCAVFKPESRKMIPDKTPERFSLYSNAEVRERPFWWKDFNSPELDRLVDTALGVNFDLRQAYARLNQSKALLQLSNASLFPELSGRAGFDHKKTNTQGGASSGSSTTNIFSLGLAASYELDLWGRIRSEKEADLLYLRESEELYQTAAMTVTASVVESWIDSIASRQEIALIKEKINTNISLLEIIELRFAKSMATALDVLRQREALAAARSALPPLEAKERILMNNLSLLLGKSSGNRLKIAHDSLPDLPALPEAGLPADLISMRPDIRASGLRLQAADWEISAARAARLPSLSLSASATYSAATIDDIFRNWLSNLAANLTGPIFDAGRRKAQVKKARAVAEERLARYEQLVFSAIRDVENALVNEDRQTVFLSALNNELKASRQSLGEAARRYLTGQISFITLQEMRLRVHTLEARLIRQQAVLLKFRVGLYRALGGNWDVVSANKAHQASTSRYTTPIYPISALVN